MNKKALIFVNLLTTVRIISVFCLLPIYRHYGGIAAAVLSLICYSTDLFDGIIARNCKVTTFFGSAYDGIADKAFTVANLLVLLTITKYALIPIFFEGAIVTIQSIKFHHHVNVQSSYAGKVKTWVIAIAVIILYLTSDVPKMHFLPNRILANWSLLKPMVIVIVIIVVSLFELNTIISYLMFLKEDDFEKPKEVPNIDIYLKKPNSFKDKWDNICKVWFSYDFYMKYKDSAGLNDILKQLNQRKKEAK